MLALSKRQRKHATRQKSNLLGGMLVRPLFGANKHVSLLIEIYYIEFFNKPNFLAGIY